MEKYDIFYNIYTLLISRSRFIYESEIVDIIKVVLKTFVDRIEGVGVQPLDIKSKKYFI